MKNNRVVLFAIAVLIGLVSWLIVLSIQRSNQINNLLVQVQTIENIKPINGKDGKTPIKGVDYTDGINGNNGRNGKSGIGLNGADGQNATPDQIAAAVADFLTANPPAKGDTGPSGDAGAPARQIQIRCNPLKLQNEWRYVGDSGWTPLDKVTSCVGL